MIRPACLTVVLLVLTPSGIAGREVNVAPERPNVVFFLADDLGWRDLGFSGSSFYDTPSIDALAESGTVFTNAYAACPVCSPTRASILAGKYPARMATTDWFGAPQPDTKSKHWLKRPLLPARYVPRLPLEEVTLAESLREAGYATGFFGKWHLGKDGYSPEDQGFDVNVGGFHRGSPPGGYFAPYKNPKLEDGPEGEHLTARLADEAAEFIAQNKERPFLAYVSFYTVHTPLQGREDLVAHYKEKRSALPPYDGPEWVQEGKRQARQYQDHSVYAAMVKSLDLAVGRVLGALDEAGLADKTIVVFFSDNGGLSTSEGSPTSNVPLRAGKGWLYEGGVREPCVIRWPGGGRGGSQVDVPVISTDFYPTLLELCGLDPRPDQHVDGVSLVPLLNGTGELERDELFWHYPHYGNQGGSPGSAIRLGAWKLIEWFEEGRDLELFDLATDIGEQTNVASEHPGLVAEMRRRLGEWRESVGARFPTKNPAAK